MPLYDMRCNTNGCAYGTQERYAGISEDVECPECGAVLQRLISAPSHRQPVSGVHPEEVQAMMLDSARRCGGDFNAFRGAMRQHFPNMTYRDK